MVGFYALFYQIFVVVFISYIVTLDQNFIQLTLYYPQDQNNMKLSLIWLTVHCFSKRKKKQISKPIIAIAD